MSSSWKDNPYGSTDIAANDLEQFNLNFDALKTNFANGSSPGAVVGMQWYDTTNKVMKMDTSDYNWVGLMHGNSLSKVWMYRNDALNGWLIDGSVVDCVTALKGGSYAYNVNAGQIASGSTWNLSGPCTLDATQIPWNGVTLTTSTFIAGGWYYGQQLGNPGYVISASYENGVTYDPGDGSVGYQTVSNSGIPLGYYLWGYTGYPTQPHTHAGSNIRPWAAVGTLQSLNV